MEYYIYHAERINIYINTANCNFSYTVCIICSIKSKPGDINIIEHQLKLQRKKIKLVIAKANNIFICKFSGNGNGISLIIIQY